MAIVNGYVTLSEFKDRYFSQRSYSAATLTFSNSGKTITDSAKRLMKFRDARILSISGAGQTGNNATWLIDTTVPPTDSVITLTAAPTQESAGATITLIDTSDTVDDATIESVITAISRLIDHETGRRFWVNTNDEDRYYTAGDEDCLRTDDIVSLTTLATDIGGARSYSAWAATDFDLMPYNASLDGKPYTKIELTPYSQMLFPLSKKGVKLTGKFGYSVSVNPLAHEACILQALRLFKRKDAPFGVTGSAEMGQQMVQIPELDPDVKKMLAPLRRNYL